MFSIIISIVGCTSFAGVFGWILHLGDRVTKVEVRQEDLPTLINSKFDEVNRRLGRIEQGMNGYLRKE